MYKKNELAKLRDQTFGELKTLITKLQKDLVETRMKFSLGKLKNVKEMKQMKGKIAQVETVLKEKEFEGEAKQKG